MPRTGFRVLPRSMSNGRVNLEIVPISAEEEPEGLVVRAGAATQVIVTEGELVLIASVQGERNEITIDPFATLDLQKEASDTVMLVTVDRIPGSRP